MKTLQTKVILNFSSTVLPMAIGLLTIPLLIEGMGVERFGMLSIAWMIVGYFGVLDMGLGRALTQKVASKIGTGETEHIKGLIILALLVVLVLGMLSSIAVSSSASYLIYDLFNISQVYLQESLRGVYWVAATIPIVILSTALFGVLEGQQYFGWTSLVRAPLNLLMFVAPLIALQWSPNLDVIFLSLFVVRLIAFISLVLIVRHSLKGLGTIVYDKQEIKSLFTYGSWISISNIISPIMVYFDRFYIAAVLSVGVVAYYTTPLDLLVKVLLIPLALIGVLFATFSTDWSHNKRKVLKNYYSSILIVFIFILPFVAIAYGLAEYGLTLWLGENFAKQSYSIAQVILIGLFFNAMAMVPYALIQGMGRADITAKLHLSELPVFVFLLWYFVEQFGLLGAAYAWSIRVALDAFLLYWMAHRLTRLAKCAI